MHAGKKGDAFQMVEIGGETNAKGEKSKSKIKANDQAEYEDTKLENFAEGNAL